MTRRPLLLAFAAALAVSGCAQRAPVPVEPAPLPASENPEIAAFYEARGGRPLWVGSGAERRVLAMLALAWADGFDPRRYRVREIAEALDAGDPQALARAELMLSEAYVGYLRDLTTPAQAARPVYAEDGLAPARRSPRALLEAVAAAPDRAARAEAARRGNAVYDALRDGLADYRRRWSALPQLRLPERPDPAPLRRRLGLADGADLAAALRRFQRVHGLAETGAADPATLAALNRGAAHYERLVRINMERARAIPADPGRRYVLVDTAAARLWMFEGRRAGGHMRVIVGKQGMATPELAARLRYAVLNPYWNVPADLARDRARAVLRRGTGILARERLQILSQFHAEDRVLGPASVDWRRVAAGREPLRLRQLPGGANVMGAVKFMMPNRLDIYLHDFPDKSLFARADRRISSGCVRLEDAQRLSAWLFGGAAPRPDGSRPEQRVNLPEPVPVYITYLTVLPAGGGTLVFRPDSYGRDARLLAALAREGR